MARDAKRKEPKIGLITSGSDERSLPNLSVVIPCYNEEAVLEEMRRRLTAVCEAMVGDDFEVILVDDGSRDATRQILMRFHSEDPRFVAVLLSRNHGHQLALTAGLSVTRGARILVLDADLQDPPELLPAMMAKMEEGFDVVYGRRRHRKGETVFKRATASFFYRLLDRIVDVSIPVDAGDFRLMTRRVVETLLNMPEQHRFIRGMISWIGYPQAALDYDRDPRFAGETKYPLRRMVRFALDAITGFSVAPLKIATWLGFLICGLSAAMCTYVLVVWLKGDVVPGWTSTTLVTLVLGGVQLFVVGILGEYVGRLYMQSKARPLFVIDHILRVERSASRAASPILRQVDVRRVGPTNLAASQKGNGRRPSKGGVVADSPADARGQRASDSKLIEIRVPMSVISGTPIQGLLATRVALARALDGIGVKSSWWLTFMLVAGVLLLIMPPIEWFQNEINYIDLALQFVAPERFPETSAVFDESATRFASFGLLGLVAEAFGRDGAMVAGRVATILAYAAALAALACAWRLSPVDITLGLLSFVMIGQSYFAWEWLFGAVEAKTLAYPAAIFAIAWATRGADGLAVVAAALATYFHFLVGGFWAAAILLLLVIRGTPFPRVARLGAAYTGIVAPLLAILVYERHFAPALDISGLDLSLNEIYAVFRNPHHVAPFASLDQFRGWIRGIAEMAAASMLLVLVWATCHSLRSLAAWLLALHGYLALCFSLAFLDRSTHFLAPLYLFRPNALILLLTLLILISWVRTVLPALGVRALAALTVCILIVSAPRFLAPIALHVAHAKPIPTMPRFETAAPEMMIEWLRTNTLPNAVVVVEPGQATNWEPRWIAFERRVDRPTLVHFKFVPTAPHDLARWYRLIRWREAVFDGACGRVREQPVDYLVIVEPSTLEKLAQCGRIVWHRDSYSVIAVSETLRTDKPVPVAAE